MVPTAGAECYRGAPITDSPVAHSPCPQLHAIDGRLADPSQYAPQYLLPLAAGQLHPGCAHLLVFFSAMINPPCLCSIPPPGVGRNPLLVAS